MCTQLLKLLQARIDLLPEIYRMVFMLYGVQELNVRETIEAPQIPEATVRTRLFRDRGLMRESLTSEIATADAFAFDGARCDLIIVGVMARLRGQGR